MEDDESAIDLNSTTGAVIVSYRYLLWRHWDPSRLRRLLWIMLNPSTANESTDDPTLQKCICISDFNGFGGLEIVNLVAYQTTKPKRLRNVSDSDALENMRYLEEAVKCAAQTKGKVVIAWGELGCEDPFKQQADAVLKLLRQYPDLQVCSLGTNKCGCPKHPLYMKCDTQLI